MRRKNAVPKRYRAYFITPGIANYDAEGIGNVLILKPALDKMLSTFTGMPVINEAHTDLEPEELFNLENEAVQDFADGVIAATGYDEKTGWYYADMMIWDPETVKNIDEHGYSVSCAYDVMETDDSGGSYNNVDYAEEVIDGKYIHMAVVASPRYERAYVIQNSKSEEEVLKIVFKKKDKKAPVKKKKVQNAEPETEDDEEETMENSDGYIENSKGEQFPIAELVNMYNAKMAKKNAAKKVYNMDDEVTVDGKKMKVSELMAAVEEDDEDELENAEPAQDEDAEEVVDETLQNATSGKPVKNANFKKVKNAADKEDKEFKPKNLNTVSERLGRGKSRYGTPVAQGGK